MSDNASTVTEALQKEAVDALSELKDSEEQARVYDYFKALLKSEGTNASDTRRANSVEKGS